MPDAFLHFIHRIIAEHHFGECGVYLVQSYRGKGSRNCGKEVSIIENAGKYILQILFLPDFSYFRLRDHVLGANNNPLLIFPEGTCVNNHYSVMFKKV